MFAVLGSRRLHQLVCGACGIWLGALTLRTFFTQAIWNLGEGASMPITSVCTAGLYAVGMAAWIPARYLGGSRPALRFGLCLVGLTVARQAVHGPLLSLVMAFATMIVWLWWLPAFLQEVDAAHAGDLVTPAALLGLVAQMAAQTADHGLDLHMMTAAASVMGVVVLAAVFLVALAVSGGQVGAAWAGDRADGSDPPCYAVGFRGALALGAYLFLALTLTNNLGAVEALGGLSVNGAAALIQLSLLAGVLCALWQGSRRSRRPLGLLAIPLALGLLWEPTRSAFLLIPLQAAVAMLLTDAFRSSGQVTVAREAAAVAGGRSLPRPDVRIYGGTAVGALLLITFIVLFYRVYGWPLLWVVTVAILGGLSWHRQAAPNPTERRAYWSTRQWRWLLFTPALLAAVGLGMGMRPYSREKPALEAAPPQLKLLQYNVDLGLDTYSVPSLTQIAATIDEAGADLVMLQEINRGWSVSGGVDMAGWLQWRFPGYHVIYGAMSGDLWGNIVMSRYPVKDWGTVQFPSSRGDLPRGLVWVKIPAEGGDLQVASLHYSTFDWNDADRVAQSAAVLAFWQQSPRTILSGDFNAVPSSAPIDALLAGGLHEATQATGNWSQLSYPAKAPMMRQDYIFLSPDLTSTRAEFGQSMASDHLPLKAVIQVP